MRSSYVGFRLTGLLMLALTGTVNVSAADRAPARVAQADGGVGDGSITVLQKITSDKDKLRYSEDSIQEMREALGTIQKMIEAARKEKDLVLLNCLNEKYSSINALLKVTETANILMSEALGQNNSQQGDHQFRKIVIARFKAKQFLQEANECSGDSGRTTSEVLDEVKIQVEVGLTGETQVTDPVDTGTDPAPPPPISQ